MDNPKLVFENPIWNDPVTTDPKGGQYLVGSLTGVVASKKVTEAPKGTLSTVGNRA